MTRSVLLALVLLPLAASAQTPSHEEAVRDLLVVSGSREAYERGLHLAVEAMGQSNPLFDQLRPVLEEFYATYARWEDVEPDFIALYLDLFSEDEVRSLIAWYQTELGQRFRETQPELQRRSMEIGQRVVMEHQAELEAMIEEALRDGAPGPKGAGAKRQ